MSENRSTAWIAGAAVAVGVALGVGYLMGHRALAPAEPSTTGAAPAATALPPAGDPPPAAPVAATNPSPAPASQPEQPAGRRWRPAEANPPAAESPGESAPPAAPAESPAPEAAPEPREIRVEIAAGTRIALRAVEPVSSQTAQAGDAIAFALAEPVVVDGRTVLPAGARVTGRVTQVVPLRKVGGQASLALAFDGVETSSGTVGIDAAWARLAKSETGKDAATIAAGAVLGAIAGNQAKKNDRGKLIGAVVGAAAGTAVAASTPGEKIELQAGAALEVTLRQPAIVTIRD